MTGAQAIIAALEAEGVKHVFGYPGGQALDIFDALGESSVIEHILVRHEQAAVHAADGYARSSGKPGVVIVTSGPGATNTVTGIACAYMDSIPLIVICGQVPTSVIGTDAFQEADITGITLPITKHSYLVKDANELPHIMKEAFYIATSGRPGPVLIDVPSDIASATLEFSYPSSVVLPSYKPTYKGNRRQVKQAVALLEAARRPVLYVGGGILASEATDELIALAEAMQIPVAVTLTGKSCFPEEHPLYLGLPGMHGTIHANKALVFADLVIAVGARFTNRVTGALPSFASSTSVIHIDIDPAEIGKNQSTDVPIVGDAKGVLADLASYLGKDDAKPHTQAWLEQIGIWRAEKPAEQHYEDGIDPTELLCGIQDAARGRDLIVATEVGQHQLWAAQYLRVARPRTFLTSGGLGAMGFGFPAAIGAQIANPSSLVVCIAGDGSFQMNIGEMATAKAKNLPVKVIIFDNGCLGMVRQWQELFYEKRYSATILDFEPDFVLLAQAYGWWGRRIDTQAEIASALAELFSCAGPGLLDVAIPCEALVLPMIPPGHTISDVIVQAPTGGE